jgi:sulfur-carrier protein
VPRIIPSARLVGAGKGGAVRGPAGDVGGAGVLVRIPSALRIYTRGQDEILLDASDLAVLILRLEDAFPGIRDRIVDETGRSRQYVNLFVNEELVRGPLTSVHLSPGDAVHILPSVAGGSHG